MAGLADKLPNVKDEEVAIGIARRAIRKPDGDEDDGLRDRLPLTAVEKDGEVYYRPFAAARAWLKANPRWLEQSGQDKWRDLGEALSGLAEDQARFDGAFALVIPPYLDNDGLGMAPGPVFAPMR